MSQTATNKPLVEPYSTGASWLSRAVSVSVVLHLAVALVWWQVMDPTEPRQVDLVDIELAPPPPPVEALPAEVARPPEAAPEAQAHAATEPPTEPEEPDGFAMHDAGVDAPIDAAVDAPVDAGRKRPRPDAGIDAEVPLVADEVLDAGTGDGGLLAEVGDAGDAGVAVAAATTTPDGAGSGAGSGEGSGVPAATEQGSGSGVAGMDNQPAVDGAPTTAGTAANLLAYFPPGHQVTALIRFDRLRGTEWAQPTERLLRPMPDYHALFGTREANVAASFDTLVISTPRPRDATATTLVVRTPLSRPRLRAYLDNTDTPIAWSATRGGMFGRRTGKVFPGDTRVLLSPWRNWVVLAPPADLPGLTAKAKGNLDKIEARAKLPPWLHGIREIEKESGEEAQRGPALVLTLAGASGRYTIPDVGLGITSLPSPQRISLAMELVKQGWLVRGNIVFASEADAIEFAQSVTAVQQRITDSRILSGLLRRQHALNIVTGLSLSRTDARVSYATSLSIADARALMAAAAATLDAYFAAAAAQPGP